MTNDGLDNKPYREPHTIRDKLREKTQRANLCKTALLAYCEERADRGYSWTGKLSYSNYGSPQAIQDICEEWGVKFIELSTSNFCIRWSE